MKVLFFASMALCAASISHAKADSLCGRISYSTFENGSTTVRLFTSESAFTAYSSDQDVDRQLAHLPTKKRNVCLSGEVDEKKLEINVEKIEIE